MDKWSEGKGRAGSRNQEMFIPGEKNSVGTKFCGSRSLSPTFGFFVIILFVFPLVLIIVIKEVGRCRERPPAGVRDIAELELRLVYNSGSRLDINSLWWQQLLQLLEGWCESERI